VILSGKIQSKRSRLNTEKRYGGEGKFSGQRDASVTGCHEKEVNYEGKRGQKNWLGHKREKRSSGTLEWPFSSKKRRKGSLFKIGEAKNWKTSTYYKKTKKGEMAKGRGKGALSG